MFGRKKDPILRLLKKQYPHNKVIKTDEGYSVLWNEKQLRVIDKIDKRIADLMKKPKGVKRDES